MRFHAQEVFLSFPACAFLASVGILKQTDCSWSGNQVVIGSCNGNSCSLSLQLWAQNVATLWIFEVSHNFLQWSNASKPFMSSGSVPPLSPMQAEPGLTLTLYLIQAWHYFHDFWLRELTTGSLTHIFKNVSNVAGTEQKYNGCHKSEAVMKPGLRLCFRKENHIFSYVTYQSSALMLSRQITV